MNDFISKAALEARMIRYKPGVRVELVNMDDPYGKLQPGDEGIVQFIDDAGTVFVRWDCGSTLGVVYGVDEIKRSGELYLTCMNCGFQFYESHASIEADELGTHAICPQCECSFDVDIPCKSTENSLETGESKND